MKKKPYKQNKINTDFSYIHVNYKVTTAISKTYQVSTYSKCGPAGESLGRPGLKIQNVLTAHTAVTQQKCSLASHVLGAPRTD